MQALEPYTDEMATKNSTEYEHVRNRLETNVEELGKNESYATLSKSEWEAITLYLAFAFVKESEMVNLFNSIFIEAKNNLDMMFGIC